ncbi:MAG TPA: caspase family protein [Candidatus Saccharimonadia bacterium]|nr:caspase family protein [Candidatus Saccharimonadia bacterium]
MSHSVRVLLVLAFLSALHPRADAAGEQRRCISFCIGVEVYDEAPLAKLNCAADDAYAIWRKLKAITNFDEKASTLRVANRDDPGNPTPGELPDKPALVEKLTQGTIETAFQHFVRGIRTGDLVIIYLGGHGDTTDPGETGKALFLASDADTKERPYSGAVRVNALLDLLREAYDNGKKFEVVLLANMCHAGAILRPGSMAVGQKSEELAKASVKESDASPNHLPIAVIPACPADEKTYEPPGQKHSEFAQQLLEGLGGARVDEQSRLTVGTLWDYVQSRNAKIPPTQHKAIVLATLLTREVALRKVLAAILVNVALDEGDLTARYKLLKLARAHYERCLPLSSVQEADLRLSLLQVGQWERETLAQLDGAPGYSEVASSNRRAITDAIAEHVERFANALPHENPDIARIQQEMRGAKPLTLPWTAWVMLCDPTSGDNDRQEMRRKDTARWKTFLESLPGCEGVQPSGWSGDWRKGPVPKEVWDGMRKPKGGHVVLVYDGSTDYINVLHGVATEMQIPFSAGALWQWVREATSGMVSILWHAPHGGALQVPTDLRSRVSLFLAAGDRTGTLLTDNYTSPEDRWPSRWFMNLVAAGFSDEAIQDFNGKYAKLIGEDGYLARALQKEGYSCPSAKLVGSGQPLLQAPGTLPEKLASLLPIHGLRNPWQAAQFADKGDSVSRVPLASTGDNPQVEASQDSMRDRPWSTLLSQIKTDKDSFISLRRGALSEVLGNRDEARALYKAFQDWKPSVSLASEMSHNQSDLPAPVRQALVQEINKLQEKAGTRYVPPSTTLHLITVAAQDYHSPLLGDLSHSRQDIKRWSESLRAAFSPAVQVNEHPVEAPTAEAVEKMLDTVVKEARPSDVIFFVFSGRGIQLHDGERYLLTEDSHPSLHEFNKQALPSLPGTDGRFMPPSPKFASAPVPTVPSSDDLDTSAIVVSANTAIPDPGSDSEGKGATPKLGAMPPEADLFALTDDLGDRDGTTGPAWLSVSAQFEQLAGAPCASVMLLDCQFTAPDGPTTALLKHAGVPYFTPNRLQNHEVEYRGPYQAYSVEVSQASSEPVRANEPVVIWWKGEVADKGSLSRDGTGGSLFTVALTQSLRGCNAECTYEEWLQRALALLNKNGQILVGSRRGPADGFVFQGPMDQPVGRPTPARDQWLSLLLSDYYRRRWNLDFGLHLQSNAQLVNTSALDRLTYMALLTESSRLDGEKERPRSPSKLDSRNACVLLDKKEIDQRALRELGLSDVLVYFGTRAKQYFEGPEIALNFLQKDVLPPEGPSREEDVLQRMVELTEASVTLSAQNLVERAISELQDPSAFENTTPGTSGPPYLRTLRERVQQLLLQPVPDLVPIPTTSVNPLQPSPSRD